jgi:TetR/AcrR family transcriptional repressor of nem operon
VKKEIQAFADINVAWLSWILSVAKVVSSKKVKRAAAPSLLPLRAHSSDISLYDSLIASYRAVGLLPE